MKSTILTAVVFAALVGFAYAKPTQSTISADKWFSEDYASLDDYVADLFDLYDKNGDGSITREEVTAHYEEAGAEAN